MTFQASLVQDVRFQSRNRYRMQISAYLINELKLGHNQVFLKAREFICPK